MGLSLVFCKCESQIFYLTQFAMKCLPEKKSGCELFGPGFMFANQVCAFKIVDLELSSYIMSQPINILSQQTKGKLLLCLTPKVSGE